MGFFSKLKDRIAKQPHINVPDDSEVTNALGVAKLANKKATEVLNAAVKKQQTDALFARQVIADVIQRSEKG